MAKRYLEGLPQLKAKLERLRAQTADKVRPAMAQGAQQTVGMMKGLVPVASGDLKNSIGWSWGAAPKGSLAIASAGVGDMKITIFAGDEKAFYARWVEFGMAPHVQGGKFKGTQHPGTRAQPFFFVSYRAQKKEIIKLLRKAIRDAVKGAVR